MSRVAKITKLSVPVILCAATSKVSATLQWTETFQSGPSGVEQFETGPGIPPMIGPSGAANNNQLQITTQDNGTNSPYFPNRAGEPLGTTVDSGTTSYSGLYDFTWSQTNNQTDSSYTEYEEIGFMGNNINQNRQISGMFIQHWYDNGHYIVQFEPCFESEGYTDTAEIIHLPEIDLGASIPADMQIAISWDQPTQTVHDAFYIGGALVQDMKSAISNMYGPHPPSYDNPTNIALEENNHALTHLGWEDYTGNGNDITTTWQVNSLSYWNDSTGALAVHAPIAWDNAGASGDGSTWDTGQQNWNNTISNAPSVFTNGVSVVFNDTNNGHYAVTLNSTVSPGSMTFSNTGSYTISGTGSIAGNGSVGLIVNGGGTVTLNTVNTFTGGVHDSQGTLIVGASGAIPVGSELDVSDIFGHPALVQLAPGSGQQTISVLNIQGNNTLDITNNHIIINYGTGPDPIASIEASLLSGYNLGAWNGPGIISSTAAVTPGYGVGYADSADPGNPAGLASGSIEIAYTLLGDANLDKTVNGVDFGILAANFNKGLTGWDQGDFNYDNAVNGVDFADLAANFNKGASGASVGAPAWADPSLVAFAEANGLMADVPEPAIAGLAAISLCGVLKRRHRRE